jgi:anti-sigma factor (TIGR02949 family)
MDCNEARPLLDAALDRELSAADARRIEQHLARCAECRREAQALRAVSDATRTAEYFRAPPALRSRLLQALPPVAPVTEPVGRPAAANAEEATLPRPSGAQEQADEPRTERPRAGWIRWPSALRPALGGPRSAPVAGRGAALGWPTGIAIVALAFALSASIALLAHRPGATASPFVDELVASHVRAQLSGRDIDVVSSDQHTVKPWFNGRLDYAPPVEDLAENGFSLIGGRLDYLNHHRVAVLVYRYRKHIVDLYVMPQGSDNATQPSVTTSDGYALARWQDHGMVWWAVSDAEPAVLAQLRAALAARLEAQTKPVS